MIELILIRHTAVKGSGQQRYLGVTDVALNRKGWGQAERISGYLKNKSIAAIYSSDLKRAYQTAVVIAKPHFLKVKKEEGFNEFDFGSWEGKTFSEIQKKYPHLAQEYLSDPLHTKISGGESFLKFGNRVDKALEQILTKEEGTVVIVSHAGVNRVMICNLLKLPLSYLWQIKQDIGAVNIIEIYQNTSVISLINQTL